MDAPVVVIGMGRFGRSLALELMYEGVEVLGIDSDKKVVQSLAGRLTHVVEADSTNVESMRELKRAGQGFTHATAETMVKDGDLIIVSGTAVDVERFSALL